MSQEYSVVIKPRKIRPRCIEPDCKSIAIGKINKCKRHGGERSVIIYKD